MNRLEFAYEGITKESKILEFAPYYCPLFPKAKGYHTETVDVCDKEKLLKKAEVNPSINDYSQIEDVDYVCSSNYANTIGKRSEYDYIVASHVIEHVTDIIAFFNDCSELLKEDGVIRLFIPDKRYIFDYYREVTSTRVAIDTHIDRKGKGIHSCGTIAESRLRALAVEKGAVEVPNSAFCYLRGELRNSNTSQKISDLVGVIHNNIEYIDVHSWVMTPKSFEIMIYELNILGFIDLVIDRIIAPDRSFEFYVDLKKEKLVEDDCEKRLQMYIDRKYEQLQEYEDMLECQRLKKELELNPADKIYIYGINHRAMQLNLLLTSIQRDFTAFIVSDGRKTEEMHEDYSVMELSEIASDNCVVLIAIPNYRNEIMPELEKRGFKTFF